MGRVLLTGRLFPAFNNSSTSSFTSSQSCRYVSSSLVPWHTPPQGNKSGQYPTYRSSSSSQRTNLRYLSSIFISSRHELHCELVFPDSAGRHLHPCHSVSRNRRNEGVETCDANLCHRAQCENRISQGRQQAAVFFVAHVKTYQPIRSFANPNLACVISPSPHYMGRGIRESGCLNFRRSTINWRLPPNLFSSVRNQTPAIHGFRPVIRQSPTGSLSWPVYVATHPKPPQ